MEDLPVRVYPSPNPNPNQVTPWTVIKRWYEQGEYAPYSEEQLCEMLMAVKSKARRRHARTEPSPSPSPSP